RREQRPQRRADPGRADVQLLGHRRRDRVVALPLLGGLGADGLGAARALLGVRASGQALLGVRERSGQLLGADTERTGGRREYRRRRVAPARREQRPQRRADPGRADVQLLGHRRRDRVVALPLLGGLGADGLGANRALLGVRASGQALLGVRERSGQLLGADTERTGGRREYRRRRVAPARCEQRPQRRADPGRADVQLLGHRRRDRVVALPLLGGLGAEGLGATRLLAGGH